MYYDWGGWITCLIVIHPVYLQIETAQTTETERVSRQSGQERTIELRIQRDQVLNESGFRRPGDTMAKAQDELVRKEKLATVGQLTQGLVDRILNLHKYLPPI